MNVLRPERLDALARDYALGLMHGGARRRFELVLRASRAAELAVLVWQERLATFAAPVPPLQPRPEVWQRLEARLQPAAAAMPPLAAPSRWGWLGSILSGRALGGALAGLLIATVVLREQPASSAWSRRARRCPPATSACCSTRPASRPCSPARAATPGS